MKTELEITVSQRLTLEHFESVIVGALESKVKGHYPTRKWALVKQKEFLAQLPKRTNFFLGDNERIAFELFNDPELVLPVYSKTEPNKQIGYVNGISVAQAYKILSSMYVSSWERFQLHEETAEDLDILFQLAALGEVRHPHIPRQPRFFN
jgi:hypothetical protein